MWTSFLPARFLQFPHEKCDFLKGGYSAHYFSNWFVLGTPFSCGPFVGDLLFMKYLWEILIKA